MSNQTCAICGRAKGKRVCLLHDNSMICPICCAKSRDSDCFRCVFYQEAEGYKRKKATKSKNFSYLVPVDQVVEDKVDQALALAEQGHLFRSRMMIKRLLKSHPENHMVQFAMGVISLMEDDLDHALFFTEKAIQIFPYFVEAWFNKGAIHQKRLEIEETIKAFQKVVEYAQTDNEAYHKAREILKDIENHIEIENHLTLDQFLKLKEIFDDAYQKMIEQKWSLALQGFQKVLSYSPDHTQSHGNMAMCLAMLGRKAKALAAIHKALELDPNYLPAISNKSAIENMKEGQPLQPTDTLHVDFYKEKVRRESP